MVFMGHDHVSFPLRFNTASSAAGAGKIGQRSRKGASRHRGGYI
jgi:hypothetical protein